MKRLKSIMSFKARWYLLGLISAVVINTYFCLTVDTPAIADHQRSEAWLLLCALGVACSFICLRFITNNFKYYLANGLYAGAIIAAAGNALYNNMAVENYFWFTMGTDGIFFNMSDVLMILGVSYVVSHLITLIVHNEVKLYQEDKTRREVKGYRSDMKLNP